jgi:O-antigen/teichoic acid export membrane protein
MSLLLRNVVATFVGTAWVGVMSVIIAPFVIHALGVEGYGLFGVLITMQALTIPVGSALSSVLMRETARLRRLGEARVERELVGTFEVLYLGAALGIMAALVAVAPLLAGWWFHAHDLPLPAVIRALRYMGVAVALQLPIAGTTGALMGLERHVASNVVNSIAVAIRVAVTIVLLRLVPSTDALFAWQALATVGQFLALRTVLWRYVPRVPAKRFSLPPVVPLFGFARGVLVTSILGTILGQMDKIVLSRIASLGDFGRYTLAATLATATGVAVSAVSLAFMPRLTAAVAHGDERELVLTYHRACQLMSVLLLPLAGVLAFFAPEILMIWTGDASIARGSAPVLTLLVLGFALNGLVAVPYALQIAAGWSELGVRINSVAVLFVVPAMIAGAELAGGRGTAAVWLALNAAYAVIGVPLMHRRLLPGQARTWWLADLLLPAAVTAGVLAAFRFAVPIPQVRVVAAVELAAIGAIAVAAAIAVTPLVRAAISDAFALRSAAR